ncbi:DUF1989 domain-containing protein [Pseudomonas sp. TE21394]
MQEIGGGNGRAIVLKKGQAVRLVNTHGTQVVDTWALALGDTSEFMSVEHTRRMLFNLFPSTGDVLYSNRRTPMLKIEEDTFTGKHDMLVACCDPWLYKHYGCEAGHRNCHDNFQSSLFDAGFGSSHVPNPLNLWMNVPVHDVQGKISLEPPVSKAGDRIVLRALIDVIVIFSACPMDITPVNGADRTLKPVHFEILEAVNNQ